MPIANLIDRYCDAWSTTDAAVRERMLRETCTDAVIYVDPKRYANSLSALSALIGHASEARPGVKVVRTTDVQEHHGLARFGWALQLPDGSLQGGGIDVVDLDPTTSRLTRIVGFFGSLTPLPGLRLPEQ